MPLESKALFEPLELRRLLSASASVLKLSAATFAGPQTTGTTWQYELSNFASYMETRKVVGPTKVGTATATHIHDSQSISSSAYSDFYQVVDASKGFQVLKETDVAPDEVSTFTTTPQQSSFPKSLSYGTAVTSSYVRQDVQTYKHKTTTSDTTYTSTLSLKYNKRVSVTTPAGTFSCFVIVEKDTNKSVKGAYNEHTYYVAPGYGKVEDVKLEVAPGSADTTSTLVLSHFTAGT